VMSVELLFIFHLYQLSHLIQFSPNYKSCTVLVAMNLSDSRWRHVTLEDELHTVCLTYHLTLSWHIHRL